jgi:hypothetical protein
MEGALLAFEGEGIELNLDLDVIFFANCSCWRRLIIFGLCVKKKNILHIFDEAEKYAPRGTIHQ